MAVHQLFKVIQNLRRTTLPDEASVSDSRLLDEFIEHQDQCAFAALVKRHGPMVWGVCRRVAIHHQDAEDAFQAAFLVLARRASSIRPREMVANWLFGVAQRTALKAKTMAIKRNTREKQVTTMPEPELAGSGSWVNLEAIIDQELASLPDKYRVAIILCDLEGRKGKDVARRLKIPEGTLASRLRVGRVMLAKRLARRGVALSGGVLATVLAQNAASAAPAALVSSTIHAAVVTAASKAVTHGVISAKVSTLMEGVVRGMLLTKLKTVIGAVLALSVVGIGGGLWSHSTAFGQQRASAGQRDETSTNQLTSPRKQEADIVRQASGNAQARDLKSRLPPRADHDEGLPIDEEKEQRIVYMVFDLVVQIHEGDTVPDSRKQEVVKTKEDWLIKKITQTVAPKSWKDAGGSGAIEYFPRGKALVVNNTPRVHAQIRNMLETMRRVQNVEIAFETKIVRLDSTTFLKVQELLPQFKKAGHAVLNDADVSSLIRKVQEDAKTSVMQTPKCTLFSGQRSRLAIDQTNADSGVDIRLKAFVVASLHQVEFELNARVGKLSFSHSLRMDDEQTLAEFNQHDNSCTLLLLTPRIVINADEESANIPPGVIQSEATRKAPVKQADVSPGADASPGPGVWMGNRLNDAPKRP